MNRLETIRDLIQQGAVVVDLGTDHCKLPNLLVRDGFKPVYATEASKGPLSQAKRLAHPEVKLSLHDGLLGFREPVDTVVIAGMGGELIQKIITDSEDSFRQMSSVILQPMQQVEALRCFLLEHDFNILEERLSREGERFYQVLSIRDGKDEPYDTRYFKTDTQDPAELIQYYLREKSRMEHLLSLYENPPYRDYLEGLESRLELLTKAYK